MFDFAQMFTRKMLKRQIWMSQICGGMIHSWNMTDTKFSGKHSTPCEKKTRENKRKQEKTRENRRKQEKTWQLSKASSRHSKYIV